MIAMTTAAHIFPVLLAFLPWEVEAFAWGVVYGVSDVTLAVVKVETGDIPEDRRDRIDRGRGVGRYQVVYRWHKDKAPSREALKDRHLNIRVGNRILADWEDICGGRRPPRQCVRPRKTHWTCHYNGGLECGDRAIRYAAKVEMNMRRRK